jgi:Predicted transcriptional regulators
MFELDLKSRTPISGQIVDNIKELIVSGVLHAEEKLPSVRELAAQLTVNPNTVQKAYSALEQQGYIYISQGRGTFVADIKNITATPAEITDAEIGLRDSISKLYYIGMSRGDAEELLRKLMDERSDWK